MKWDTKDQFKRINIWQILTNFPSHMVRETTKNFDKTYVS